MAEFHPLRSKLDLEDDPAWEILNNQAVMLAKNEPTAPLPSLDHLTFQDYQNVYEPSDDTYLLLDALQYEFTGHEQQEQQQAGQFHTTKDQDLFRVLEIGCGSGVPSVFFRLQWRKQQDQLQEQLQPTQVETTSRRQTHLLSLVTDVNPRALSVTKETFLHNDMEYNSKNNINNDNISSNNTDYLEAIQCDLASALLPRLAGQVDVILFNPPYVPTPDEEVGGAGIEAAWAGGVHGRRVVDRAVEQMAQLLRPRSPVTAPVTDDNTGVGTGAGVAYLITVDDNRPVELAGIFREHGLSMKPLFRRRAHNEYLTVQKITWILPSSSNTK
jgi:release factor glutamine methyltransferase